MDISALIQTALLYRTRAYAPYSHFAVGAALVTKTGELFGGCNIENASYGPSICAERTAVFKALSEGHRDFCAIAIVGGPAQEPFPNSLCAPCGVCRQVLCEFCDETFQVILARSQTEYEIHTLGELLPLCFTLHKED